MLMALLPSDKYCVRIFHLLTTFYPAGALIMIAPYVVNDVAPLWSLVVSDMANTPEGGECTTASRQQAFQDLDTSECSNVYIDPSIFNFNFV